MSCLPEEGQAAAGVGRGQSLVPGDRVPLCVFPLDCLILALGVSAPECLLLTLTLTVQGRGVSWAEFLNSSEFLS